MDKRQTTQRKIGQTTYLVVAGASEDARERLETKINKLLRKDIRKSTENR